MSVRSAAEMLRPEHAEHLARFRIPSEMLEAAGVYSANDSDVRELLGQNGFHPGEDLSGIMFPCFSPTTGARVGARVKLDRLLSGGGKYVSEPGCRHFFFPPGVSDHLRDAAVTAVVVEAEKSALALRALCDRAGTKLLLIAISGCWGWKRKIGKRPLPDGNSEPETGPSPDFDLVTWQGRQVALAFDSNAASNPSVRKARRALAQELAARGANVLIADVPAIEGVNGPDDLIAVSGDDAMVSVLDTARPFAECVVAEAEQGLAALEADKKSDPLPAIKAIAAVEDAARRALLIARLAALRVPGVNQKFVEREVRDQRAEAEADREKAAEACRRGRLMAMDVEGAALFGELEDFFSKRCWLPEHAPLVESLFTILTYCSDHFSTVPYICTESATPGCGKSTNLDLCAAVVARPLHSVGLSRAVLVRQLDERRVTLLLDESEWLSAHSETAEAIRGILHAGYRRGASYQLCEGDDHEMRDFQVFGPKVFSAILGLIGALLDRCIVIHMERLPEGQTLLPAAVDDLEPMAAPLRERLDAFALQINERLGELRRERPPGGYWREFRNREAELWHPLLTIARVCGREIEDRALKAARAMSRAKQLIQADENQIAQGRELVEVLQGMECQRFRPADVVESLEESEAWAEVLAEKKDQRAKTAAIGRYLNRFRLRSHKRSRTGSTYDRLETIEVVGRHMPRVPPGKSATSATSATNPEKTDVSDLADRSTGLQPDLQQSSTSAPSVAEAVAKDVAHRHSNLPCGSADEHVTCGSVADVADNSGPEEEL